ncbi:MAG: hypothetical protein WKG07_35640 [Hymenobacter sp.]
MQPPEPRLLPWPAAAASPRCPGPPAPPGGGALRTGRPLAIWREPGAARARLLVSRSAGRCLRRPTPALDPAAPAGFAFFPFRESDHNPALFLPADVQYDLARPEVVSIAPAAREAGAQYRGLAGPTPPPALAWHHGPQPAPPATTKADYCQLVQLGVAAIEAKEVVKVVELAGGAPAAAARVSTRWRRFRN